MKGRHNRPLCYIHPSYKRILLLPHKVTRYWKSFTQVPGGGGGGGGGGCIRSLSKLKNTPKALISGQKSTLILIKKRWLFPVNKHPFFYQNTGIGWAGTRISTLDFIILYLFSGSKPGSPVTSGVTRCQSRIYFVDCKGIFTPHTSYLGSKKYPSFTKSRTCGGLKKDPFFREIRNAGKLYLSAPRDTGIMKENLP